MTRRKKKQFKELAITAYNDIVDACIQLENEYPPEMVLEDLGFAATGLSEWLESLGVTVPKDEEDRVGKVI